MMVFLAAKILHLFHNFTTQQFPNSSVQQFINCPNMKAMTRQKLALKAGVHPDTLGRWLKRHQHTLEALGLLPGMHLLPPKVVK